MKKTLVLGLLMLACAAPAQAAVEDAVPLNIGHRGASGYAPEHTFAAYDLRARDSAPTTSSRTCSSPATACSSSCTTRRSTARRAAPAENCTGLVNDKTLAQIKTCDVGTWFNEAYPSRRPEYVGLKIPTLEEVFQRYGTTRQLLHRDEDARGRGPGMEEQLLALLDKYELREPAGATGRC